MLTTYLKYNYIINYYHGLIKSVEKKGFQPIKYLGSSFVDEDSNESIQVTHIEELSGANNIINIYNEKVILKVLDLKMTSIIGIVNADIDCRNIKENTDKINIYSTDIVKDKLTNWLNWRNKGGVIPPINDFLDNVASKASRLWEVKTWWDLDLNVSEPCYVTEKEWVEIRNTTNKILVNDKGLEFILMTAHWLVYDPNESTITALNAINDVNTPQNYNKPIKKEAIIIRACI